MARATVAQDDGFEKASPAEIVDVIDIDARLDQRADGLDMAALRGRGGSDDEGVFVTLRQHLILADFGVATGRGRGDRDTDFEAVAREAHAVDGVERGQRFEIDFLMLVAREAWRTVAIATEMFPRDDLDMSLDFGHIKKVMRDLDHRMLVVESDTTFMNPALFEPEGVVVMQGKGPSVENVAHYVFDKVVALIHAQYPDRGVDYRIEVTIQETENNCFVVEKTATV